jgi:hypothetical protein
MVLWLLCAFWINASFLESSTLLGRATLQGLVLFDHVNFHMFKLLEHFDFNRLRGHPHFCMLMHLPSTHQALASVQSEQVDFQIPAPLLIKAPRARLWAL